MTQNPIQRIKIKLDELNLFGNDAADLEKENLFISYAVERDELNELLNTENAIQVIRAYKGEGKSALLRILKGKLNQNKNEQLIITALGPDHSPVVNSTDSDVWTREWKKSILKLVANEIGAEIGFAFNDDATSLVEEAESNGFKSRSLVSSIIDRIKLKDLERDKPLIQNHEKLLARFTSGRPLIWVIIDDVDQNFQNTDRWRTKVGTFFTACRQIATVIPEIRIRTSIRPNVWAIVKRDFESLSHIEQYMHDLSWTSEQYRTLLAARIKAYLKRTSQWDYVYKTLPREAFLRDQSLISLAFDDPMPWGGGSKTRPPHVVLWTLTGHRPRWLVELCKEAGAHASERNSHKIQLSDLTDQLGAFGRKRIEDTVAEFRSQCPQIEDLLGAFSRESDLYSTDELLKTIRNRILNAVNPTISGVLGKPSDMDIAHFLFQIGFLSGRVDYGEHQGYDHYSFREKPTLLKSKTNLDEGLRWEINPVFRDVLNLRSVFDKRHTKSGHKK